MHRRIWLNILVFITCFFIIDSVDAIGCTTKELNNLKQLATNIKFDYELLDEEGHNGIYYFNILTTNFMDQFYIVDSLGHEFRYVENLNQNGVRILRSVKENSNIKFSIYASDITSCDGVKILSKEIKVPYFNQYSLNKECLGIEEFSLCQRYYGGYIESEESFLKQVAAYKKEKQLDSLDENKNFFKILTEFLISNIMPISLGLVLIVITIIFFVIKRKNRKKIKI